ncbi:MAG: hypothetical protein GYB65_23870 [Chloroflexi bacterium]|nr:hypothetical protein [Chloroflexota bacterium]
MVEHNALTELFDITPRPFAPENLAYMRDFSAVGSIKRFMGQSTADDIKA